MAAPYHLKFRALALALRHGLAFAVIAICSVDGIDGATLEHNGGRSGRTDVAGVPTTQRFFNVMQ